MGVKYIYSNCLGVLILNPDFSIVETVKISNLDQDFTEWLDEEKEAVKKYSKDELFYLGNKKEKLQGIKLTQDPKKISALVNFLKTKREELYNINLLQTKIKVRESVNEDFLIIQTINNLEEINKAINMLSKRLREWYELYNPEFSRSLEAHEKFVELILKKDKEALLKEIDLKKELSMGADFKESDLKPIKNLASQIKSLFELKTKQEKYLESMMETYCPNITAIAGPSIAAKLLEHAGSLLKLAEFPSSTVQLLGAEKALFRHMKTGAKCPKYGVIINHPLVSKAKEKGKASRALADKLSIAAKVDLFKGEFIGDQLLKGLEERFK